MKFDFPIKGVLGVTRDFSLVFSFISRADSIALLQVIVSLSLLKGFSIKSYAPF